ncbi:helix-turn-helix transcriptional regulator [Luteibacter sp. PPL554]
MELSGFLAAMREREELSLRGLKERAADLDHAYIYRLEKGDRTAPSVEVRQKLAQALRLSEREGQVLELLAEQSVDDALYRLMLADLQTPWEDLRDAARLSFRGERPTTEEGWMKRIQMIQDL